MPHYLDFRLGATEMDRSLHRCRMSISTMFAMERWSSSAAARRSSRTSSETRSVTDTVRSFVIFAPMMACPHNACATRADCTRRAHHTATGCFYSKLRPVPSGRCGGLGSCCRMGDARMRQRTTPCCPSRSGEANLRGTVSSVTEERGPWPLTDWCRGNTTGGPLVLPVCAGCAKCAALLA
jgi:hypothetical protein